MAADILAEMSTTDPVDRLDDAQLAAVLDHVSRLKHDLGKYVSLQVRWLAPDASSAERRDALAADLLSTRRGPDGEQDAASVWAEFRPGLVARAELAGGATADLTGAPELEALDAAMGRVERVAGLLRAGSASEDDIDDGEAAAREVADSCRTLFRRLRAAGGRS